MADTQERGNSVEKPTHAAGVDAVEPSVDLLPQNGQFVGRRGCHARQIVTPVDAGSGEVRERYTIRPFDRRVAAWQFDIFQMRRSSERSAIRNENLSAPYRTVGAESGSIISHADNIFCWIEAVLSHH